MNLPIELLIENGKYGAGSFAILLLLGLVFTTVFVRGATILLRSKLLDASPLLVASFRRRSWFLASSLIVVSGLLIGFGVLRASVRQIHFGEYVRAGISQLRSRDWTAFGIGVAKAMGVALLTLLLTRLLLLVVDSLRERLQRAESLSSYREQLRALLDHLRRALRVLSLFAVVVLSAQQLGVSTNGVPWLTWLAYLCLVIYIGRVINEAVQLVICVLFGLSEKFAQLENPLRYLSRIQHLSPLTARAAEYFVFVALATWWVDQINPGSWAGQTGRLALRIIAIFYLSRVVVEVCLLMISEFFLHRGKLSPGEYQQRQTLVPVAAGGLRYAVYFAAVLMMLREAGFDTTPLWAGAGAVGVAFGLGGQSLVGDLVAGFFILFESLFLVGDFIEVGEVKGKVEEIGIRITKVRDESGVLHAIPNGEIRRVASHSKGYVNVVIDIPIAYGENLHSVMSLLAEKSEAVRAAEPTIVAETEFAIEDLREGSLLLRTVTMVKPGMSKEMSDVLRLGFWEALSAAGVSSPHSRHLILSPTQVKSEIAQASPKPSVQPHRSDIQKIKAHNLFLALDVDENDSIERSDLDSLAVRVLENQRQRRESPTAMELLSTLHGFWKELALSVDRNEDGRISREEFLKFCVDLPRDLSGSVGHCVRSLSAALFVVCDRNQTGSLSESEFVQFARACGITEAVATAGFLLIDRDRNGAISKEEWLRFMQDVFVSHKLGDAAALVFGPGCRDRDSEDN